MGSIIETFPGCKFRVFFFSSRRRHTRFDCDWSSDVCSSGLHFDPAWQKNGYIEAAVQLADQWCRKHALPGMKQEIVRLPGRSEERRVGKECRSRWWPRH